MDKDSLFVSDHDLVALTGYKNKTGQIKYLKSIGIPFNVRLCFNNPLMWISTLKPPNFCKKFGGFKI